MRNVEQVMSCLEEGVVVTGPEGQVLDFNDAALDVLGLTALELRRHVPLPGVWALLSADLTRSAAPEALVRETKKPLFRQQYTLRMASGVLRELLVSAMPVPDGRVATAYLDVSRELAVVNELRVFERFFELSGDLLMVTSAATEVVHANERAHRLLSVAPSRADAVKLASLIHAEDAETFRRAFDAAAGVEFMARVKTSEGEWRHVTWKVTRSASPTRDARFVSGHDVSSRVEQLNHITRSRELLSEAFDLAELAVLEKDLATGATSATRQLFELLQLENDAAVPGSLDAWLVPEDLSAYVEYRRAIAHDQTPPPLALRLRTARGELRHVRLWERLARDGGGPRVTRELTVLQDVTQQSLLQAQIRLTDRLTSLGTMAAGVAHEINNPLAFVLGNLNVVKSVLAPLVDVPGVDLTDLRDAVNEALDGAERMRQIVSSLKPFSRVDEHHRGHCDVPRIIQASLNMAKNELRHRARVISELRPVKAVLGNEAKLSQVFLNLLVNAAQAMPDGHASENMVTITTREEGAHVIATISDTGSGIPADVLPRIFDPFFSTKQIGSGTGLGLFVSLGIVKEIGGTITVTSRPGNTTFEVRLPVSTTAFTGSSTTPAPTAKRARLLVIDDEPAILRALERMLARSHELTLARNGKEALALLGAGLQYDLILCDLMMPEVSGIDVWEQLSAEQQTQCVFMTGGTFTDRAERFLTEKKVPLLEKPFTASTLEGLLHEVQTSR